MKKTIFFWAFFLVLIAACKTSQKSQAQKDNSTGMTKTEKGAVVGATSGAVVGGIIGNTLGYKF